jgi:hypothetical protein
VHAFLTARFAAPFLTLSAKGYKDLVAAAASRPIVGGSAYDALIAFTANTHQATLITLDRRAATASEAVGATVEQLLA